MPSLLYSAVVIFAYELILFFYFIYINIHIFKISIYMSLCDFYSSNDENFFFLSN